MTYVYKSLPGGGFSTLPAESPVVVARLVAQGWSETPPVAPSVPVADPEPVATDAPADEAPSEDAPRRGRRKATVN